LFCFVLSVCLFADMGKEAEAWRNQGSTCKLKSPSNRQKQNPVGRFVCLFVFCFVVLLKNTCCSLTEVSSVSAVEPKKPLLSDPVFCPPVAPLDGEKLGKIVELKKRVESVMIPHYADKHSLIRFLGARQVCVCSWAANDL
jgi:hypothetical protein